MLEVTGIAAIIAVLTSSVLLALFAGEAFITWTIRMMDAGVRRADASAARAVGQPIPSRQVITATRPRLQRV